MIYTYETVPTDGSTAFSRFEIKQSIHESPLTHHPETGVAIRRVITGGIGLITGKSSGNSQNSSRPSHSGCGCGHGGCGHG